MKQISYIGRGGALSVLMIDALTDKGYVNGNFTRGWVMFCAICIVIGVAYDIGVLRKAEK